MSPSINGKYNPSTGVIQLRKSDIYNAMGPTGLRGRMTELEKDPFVFSEKMGLRPQKRLSYQQIEILCRSMPVIYSCMDYIISRAISFPFKIVKSDGTKHNNFSQMRAERARKVLAGPNQFGHTWRSTLKMIFTNALKRDLMTIEKQNLPAGGIKQINVIDSIKMRPNPKNFQGDLSAPAYFEMDQMYMETIVNTYSREEIVWANLNPQAGSFYGFSPIEILDLIILTFIYSSRHNLKLVHPNSERGGGIIYLGNIGKAARQEFEDRYALMREADPGRPMFTGGGDTAPSFLDLRMKNDLDYANLIMALSEMTVSAFGLSLQDIGIRSKASAGATAEMDDAITQKTAIIPRMLMLEDILTTGIVAPAGGDDLAIKFMTKKDEPLEVRVRAGSMALGRGGLTMNEYREMIDETLEPYEGAKGNTPFIIAGSQVIRLDDAVKKAVLPKDGGLDLSRLNPAAPKKNGDPAHRNTNIKNDRGTDQNWSN